MKWINGEANCEEWTHLTMTSMLELESTVPVAQKWTCGKPTAWLNLSLLTPAKLKDNIDAKELNAETTLLMKDTMVSVIRMVAIGLLSVLEMKNSMDQEKPLIPTQELPLSHNGSPPMVLQMVT